MADIILNDEDILSPFTEETPVHADFMNPIINGVNNNTRRSKENTSAIGQIADERGYINSKNANQKHIDTLTSNGKYMNVSGMPVAGTWVIDVTSHNSTFLTQYASCIYDSIGLGYTDKILVRNSFSGIWKPWKEIATTETFNPVLLSGNSIISNPTILPTISRSGKTAVVSMTIDYAHSIVCVSPYLPAKVTYFKIYQLLGTGSYRGAMGPDGILSSDETIPVGTRVIINFAYPCQ